MRFTPIFRHKFISRKLIARVLEIGEDILDMNKEFNQIIFLFNLNRIEFHVIIENDYLGLQTIKTRLSLLSRKKVLLFLSTLIMDTSKKPL